MKHAGVVVAGLALACSHHHHARVHSAELGPPPIAMVPHSSRLWIELEGSPDRQCEQTATERALCFAEIQAALGSAFTRTLWPSFPDVAVKTKGDDVEPGDYLLHVRLRVDSHPPDATGPGHAASIRGSWQLVRDGLPLAGESVSSRSRGDFAYGRPLGGAAGEVVDAVALHVASVIGTLPELRPAAQRPLPAVSTRKRTGALLGSAAASCQSSDDAKRCSMASR